MIEYRDILGKLAAAGYSTYRLEHEKIMSSATVDRIRQGKSFTVTTLDLLCSLCKCQPNELLRWVPDEEEQE